MKEEKTNLISLIQQAQRDTDAADAFVRSYMPFVKSETAKFLHRVPDEQLDDELSIAMFGFYEALMRYRITEGAFFPFARMVIRSRLIDYCRKEQKQAGLLSLDEPVMGEEEKQTLLDKIPEPQNEAEQISGRLAAREEIEEFSEQLGSFGITLSDVAENCPKQERTFAFCMQVLRYAKGHQGVLEQLVTSRKLPITELSQQAGVPKKALERHRKYVVAILLAYTNGFEIIRGHLCQIEHNCGKGGNAL